MTARSARLNFAAIVGVAGGRVSGRRRPLKKRREAAAPGNGAAVFDSGFRRAWSVDVFEDAVLFGEFFFGAEFA